VSGIDRFLNCNAQSASDGETARNFEETIAVMVQTDAYTAGSSIDEPNALDQLF